MTKKEIAQAVATEMNKINSNIDIERITKVLMKGMTTHELEAALRGYTKTRQKPDAGQQPRSRREKMKNLYRISVHSNKQFFKYMIEADTAAEAIATAKEITEARGTTTAAAKITYEILFEG